MLLRELKEKEINMKMLHLSQVGAELANESDDEQAELFNSFGRHLKIVCKDGRWDMQLAYLAGKLDKHGIEVLEAMGGFASMQKEDPFKTK